MRDDQTKALMSKEGLRNRLLGTWQLVSSVIRFEDGEFRDQLGYDPSGFLIYTAEGGWLTGVAAASSAEPIWEGRCQRGPARTAESAAGLGL